MLDGPSLLFKAEDVEETPDYLLAFLDLEAGFENLILPGWEKERSKAVKKASRALERGYEEDAIAAIQEISTEGVIRRAKGKALQLGVASLLYGARNASGLTRGTVFEEGLPKELFNALDQLWGMVGPVLEQHCRYDGLMEINAIVQELKSPMVGDAQGPVEVRKADPDFVSRLNKAVDSGGQMMASLGANLTTSRLVTYGFLAEAVRIGLTTYRLQAILDSRTSNICKNLNGREFHVPTAYFFTQQVLQLTDPEDLRAAHPWLKGNRATVEDLKSMPGEALQAKYGILVPPFHPRCRTILGKGTTVVNAPALPSTRSKLLFGAQKKLSQFGALAQTFLGNESGNLDLGKVLGGKKTYTQAEKVASYKALMSYGDEFGFAGSPSALKDMRWTATQLQAIKDSGKALTAQQQKLIDLLNTYSDAYGYKKVIPSPTAKPLTDLTPPQTPYPPHLQAAPDAPLKSVAQTSAALVDDGPVPLATLGKYVKAKTEGSNPGGLYEDSSGVQWLVKGNVQKVSGAVTAEVSNARAKNEVLAARLMNEIFPGSAPEMRLVQLGDQYGGGLGVASKMLPGVKSYASATPAMQERVRDLFALQAWLANHDVIGLDFDNVVFTPQGMPVNIDPGGAILFRAMGLKKASFGDTVGEWDSMRDPNKAPQAAQVFKNMTPAQLKSSAAALTVLGDTDLRRLVSLHGPGTVEERKALADTLIARRQDILKKAGITEGSTTPTPTSTPPPAPVVVPVKATNLPPPPPAPAQGGPTTPQAYQQVKDKVAQAYKGAFAKPLPEGFFDTKTEQLKILANYEKQMEKKPLGPASQKLYASLQELLGTPPPLPIMSAAEISAVKTAYSKAYGKPMPEGFLTDSTAQLKVLSFYEKAAAKKPLGPMSAALYDSVLAIQGKTLDGVPLAATLQTVSPVVAQGLIATTKQNAQAAVAELYDTASKFGTPPSLKDMIKEWESTPTKGNGTLATKAKVALLAYQNAGGDLSKLELVPGAGSLQVSTTLNYHVVGATPAPKTVTQAPKPPPTPAKKPIPAGARHELGSRGSQAEADALAAQGKYGIHTLSDGTIAAVQPPKGWDEEAADYVVSMGRRLKLTTAQNAAIKSYTGSGYASMNGYLRNGRVGDWHEEVPRNVAALESAFETPEARLPASVMMYRGIRNELAMQALGLSDLSPESLAGLMARGEVGDSAVQSFSLSRKFSNGWRGPKGGVLFQVKVHAGVRALPVAHLSSSGKMEAEVILPPGTKIEITGIRVTPEMGVEVFGEVFP